MIKLYIGTVGTGSAPERKAVELPEGFTDLYIEIDGCTFRVGERDGMLQVASEGGRLVFHPHNMGRVGIESVKL